ncbi:unnamed protein product [Gordionus sp. m RMFG-2023]
MPDNKKIVLRIRSPEGTKRLIFEANEKTINLINQVKAEFNLLNNEEFHLYLDQNRSHEISTRSRSTLNTYKLNNGDMLFIDIKNKVPPIQDNKIDDVHALQNREETPKIEKKEQVANKYKDRKEDEIDLRLWVMDGKIKRKPDPKYCHHPKNSKCVHCTQLEPYDENYMKNHIPPIKYMSFHSYLRKLMAGDKNKSLILEPIACKIKPGCKEHKPWPKGICTKCQPNAITLTGQPYRHVDNIVFENSSLVERFLDFWRRTGLQRSAICYGYYTTTNGNSADNHDYSLNEKKSNDNIYSNIPPPLSIQAIVCALYEPPQESARDHIEFIHDSENMVDDSFNNDETKADYVAEKLGLRKVGWIFTDLIAKRKMRKDKSEGEEGKVSCLRNKDTYFLSASECVIAASNQNLNPNICRLSTNNVYGSKFFTVIVTGDENESIHFEGYQVSEQCCALVRDGCLLPTKECPELAFVKPSTNIQYVPDVFYKTKDEYGNEVTQQAGTFPVEFAIINVPASHPLQPVYTFNSDHNIPPFPLENRIKYTDDNQTFYSFAHHVKPYLNDKTKLMKSLNDFHLLIFLANMDILPMRNDMDKLLLALKNKDLAMFEEWCNLDNWLTLQKLIEMEGPTLQLPSHPSTSNTNHPNLTRVAQPFSENFLFHSHNKASPIPANSQSTNINNTTSLAQNIPPNLKGNNSNTHKKWTCNHCTFVNERLSRDACEVCGLPAD